MSRRLARHLAAAAWLGAAGPGWAWGSVDLEVGLVARELRERADTDGRLLVRETALGPRIAATWSGRGAGPWWPVGRFDAWAADARYDGRSQAGASVASRTGTGVLAVEAVIRHPVAAELADPAWLEVGLQAEYFVRRIRGVGLLGGLDERTLQTRATVGAGAAGTHGSWRALLFAGPPAPLKVRFDGDVFDAADLHSGAVRGLSIESTWNLRPGWSLVLSSEVLRVGPSGVATLSAGGQPAGTVRQPAWTRHGVGLALRRSIR